MFNDTAKTQHYEAFIIIRHNISFIWMHYATFTYATLFVKVSTHSEIKLGSITSSTIKENLTTTCNSAF